MNPNTKLNPDQVNAMIESVTYIRTPSGKTIVCEIMLVSGYSCIGIGRVIDLDNDNEERGKEAARTHAMDEVYSYAAVVMQETMHRGALANRNKEILAEYQTQHGGQPRLI